MSQSGEGEGRENLRRSSLPDPSPEHSEGGQREENEEQSSQLRGTQRRRLSSPPSGSNRNEDNADATGSPQPKRLHTTEDGEGPSPANVDASQAGEPDTARDGQHTSTTDADLAQADTLQPDRVEQHATTADETQPLEEAPNLATEEQYVSPTDAPPPHEESFNLAIGQQYASPADACRLREESLNLFRVEQHASTADAYPHQEEAPIITRDVLCAPTGFTYLPNAEALNLINDELHASASFTAPPDAEVLNETVDNRYPPLQQGSGVHINVSELPERHQISTAMQQLIDPTIQLLNELMQSQSAAHLPSSTVFPPLRAPGYVDECDEVFVRQLLSRPPRVDRGNIVPMGHLETSEYDDPLRRSDWHNYFGSLEESFSQDSLYMSAYNSQFLVRCGIDPDTRACLIQWMIQVHMWMHIPTETLHVAVGLMDLYTYLRPITSQEYQLLALAVIRLAAYDRPPEITISRKRLCALAMDAYTPAQLQNMEEALEACVGNRINFPTPYTYMEHYVMGVSEFSSAKIKWAINLCKYFFDLGLCQVDLCQYSASLRCAGVLYLIRRMLGPGHSTGYRGDLCLRNPWPTLMEKYTGHKETVYLRRVARLYGQLHAKIGGYAMEYYFEHRTNVPHTVVFNKYLKEQYGRIAMDKNLQSITEEFLHEISPA